MSPIGILGFCIKVILEARLAVEEILHRQRSLLTMFEEVSRIKGRTHTPKTRLWSPIGSVCFFILKEPDMKDCICEMSSRRSQRAAMRQTKTKLSKISSCMDIALAGISIHCIRSSKNALWKAAPCGLFSFGQSSHQCRLTQPKQNFKLYLAIKSEVCWTYRTC